MSVATMLKGFLAPFRPRGLDDERGRLLQILDVRVGPAAGAVDEALGAGGDHEVPAGAQPGTERFSIEHAL